MLEKNLSIQENANTEPIVLTNWLTKPQNNISY